MSANAPDQMPDDEGTSTGEVPRLASEPGDTESSGLQAPSSSRHPEHSVPWDCWRHCGPRLGWWLLACVLAWLLGLPVWFDLILFAGLLAVAVVARRAQLLAFSISYLLAIISLELAVRALTKPGEVKQFYRPHEMMERHVSAQPALDPPLPRYEPNTDFDFEMLHGDLFAVDRGAPKALLQPRKVHFRTDKYGLRNDADYNGQRVLLVGDSFVAGTGSDQSLCMANVLARKHDILAYSLAHVHAPDHYMARLDWGFKRLPVPRDTKGLAFIFEGNDFASPQPLSGRPPAVPGWFDARKLETIAGVRNAWRTTEHLFNATRQLERLLFPSENNAVETYRLGSHYVGFFGYYIDVARAPELNVAMSPNHPPSLLKRLAAVFFVPTKYRVYAEWINDGRPPLRDPAPGFEAVRRIFSPLGVPVVDLTPRLREGARALLPKDEYVYYRDDTHWNAAGVEIGAAAVAETLAKYAGSVPYKRTSAPKPPTVPGAPGTRAPSP